jgi:hypothetical protein
MNNKVRKELGFVVFGALLAGSVAAADNVAQENIAAIYQPTLRMALVSEGSARTAERTESAADAVSLLDGIVLDWRDPSRKSEDRSAEGAGAAADANENVALENIRGIYQAYSAN